MYNDDDDDDDDDDEYQFFDSNSVLIASCSGSMPKKMLSLPTRF